MDSYVSSDPQSISEMESVRFILAPFFLNKKAKAKRGHMNCPRPHSRFLSELRVSGRVEGAPGWDQGT